VFDIDSHVVNALGVLAVRPKDMWLLSTVGGTESVFWAIEVGDKDYQHRQAPLAVQ
jgi:hypothetical protein